MVNLIIQEPSRIKKITTPLFKIIVQGTTTYQTSIYGSGWFSQQRTEKSKTLELFKVPVLLIITTSNFGGQVSLEHMILFKLVCPQQLYQKSGSFQKFHNSLPTLKNKHSMISFPISILVKKAANVWSICSKLSHYVNYIALETGETSVLESGM